MQRSTASNRAANHCNRKWVVIIIKGIIVLLLFYLINFTFWDVLVNHQIATPQWASFIVYASLFIVVLAFYWKHLGEQWRNFHKQRPVIHKFLLELLLWTIGGTSLTLLVIVIFGNLLGIDLLSQNQENLNQFVEQLPEVLSFCMMALFGPVIEELVFRQGLIGWVNRGNRWLFVLMTALSIFLFDIIHIFHLTEFWYYLPMSLVLTMFYLKYERNIWSSILFHSFNNAAGVLLMIFQRLIS